MSHASSTSGGRAGGEAPAGSSDALDTQLAASFREFARTTRRRAPTYARLSAAIADDPRWFAALHDAPPTQRQPVLLFAAVHHLLLTDHDHPLGRHYASITDDPDPSDPVPAFVDFVRSHDAELRALVSSRSTQTNEVGRCATFVVALSALTDHEPDDTADDQDAPLGLVDVGTSAGLNLLLDRYHYRFETQGRPPVELGDSPVELVCEARRGVPLPHRLPRVDARIGLDRAPIDVTSADEARWLRACVWPDQVDRSVRLGAAIDLARESPPEVVTGDAVADLAATVARVPDRVTPVVMHSWVLSYFDEERRRDFVAEVDRLGAANPQLVWVFQESPRWTPGLPWADDAVAATDHTVLTVVRYRTGRRRVEHLAEVHPHGYWIRPTASATATGDRPPW